MDGGVVSHKQWRHQRGQRVIDEEDEEEISGKEDDKEDDYESTSLSSVSDTSSSDDGGGAGDANAKMPKKNGGGRTKKASRIVPGRPNIAVKLYLLVLDIKYQIEMRSYGIHDPQRA